MKTRFLLFLLLLPGDGSFASDQDALVVPPSPAVALNYPGSPTRLQPPEAGTVPVAPTPLHVYGGGSVTFPLAVQAPLGTHLRICADLLQTTGGSIAVPLQRNVPVSPELVFDTRTYMEVACTLPTLASVIRTTPMRLTLRTDPEKSDPSSTITIPVFVYPHEEPGTWKKTLDARLTRSGLHRLAVFGKGQMLRRFLRERRVAFEDLGEDWPADPDTHTLYLGDTPVPAPRWVDEFAGLRLVLFSSPVGSSGLLPGVYQTADPSGGSIWKVTLPISVGPLNDDPLAQETLEEIFRLALEPRTSPRPVPTSKPHHPTNEIHVISVHFYPAGFPCGRSFSVHLCPRRNAGRTGTADSCGLQLPNGR